MSSGFVYLPGVATLRFDRTACNGCGTCVTVCPHAVFAPVSRAVEIRALDRCIECGACARNCPEGAIAVEPGTGCALAILKGWLSRGVRGRSPDARGKPC